MIPLAGSILAGLDEFMLRVGHLSCVCALAAELRGSWTQTERELSEELTRLTMVDPDCEPQVAKYLAEKELCRVVENDGVHASKRDYRYPALTVSIESGIHRLSVAPDEKKAVWWQDLCLSSPDVRSRVGAATINKGKSGSKTGLSHIMDWVSILNLATHSGELSAEGHLVASLGRFRVNESWTRNPYVIGVEKIIYAYLLLSADLDVFQRLTRFLLSEKPPIRKQSGAAALIKTVAQISEEAEHSQLTTQQMYRLSQHIRDLDVGGQHSPTEKPTVGSTAWHRTASRLEMYVDLGLLEKGRGGGHELYEYVYYPTDALRRAQEATEETGVAGVDWVDKHLMWILFGGPRSASSVSAAEILELVPLAVDALSRAANVMPLSSLSLGISCILHDRDQACSVAAVRSALEGIARENPSLARLSRGSSGERPEFISFTPLALRRTV